MSHDTYTRLVTAMKAAGMLRYDLLRAPDRDCPYCRGSGRVDYDGDEYPPGTCACFCRGATSPRVGLGSGDCDDRDYDGDATPPAAHRWPPEMEPHGDCDDLCGGCNQATGVWRNRAILGANVTLCQTCWSDWYEGYLQHGRRDDDGTDCAGSGDTP